MMDVFTHKRVLKMHALEQRGQSGPGQEGKVVVNLDESAANPVSWQALRHAATSQGSSLDFTFSPHTGCRCQSSMSRSLGGSRPSCVPGVRPLFAIL